MKLRLWLARVLVPKQTIIFGPGEYAMSMQMSPPPEKPISIWGRNSVITGNTATTITFTEGVDCS